MTELSEKTMKRIEAQAEEKEYELMVDLLLGNNDENVNESLQQALAVVKLIYSEDIDEKVRAYKEQKINQAKGEIIRKKKDIERMHAESIYRQKKGRDTFKKGWKEIFEDISVFEKDNLWKKYKNEIEWRLSTTLDDDLWKEYMKRKIND